MLPRIEKVGSSSSCQSSSKLSNRQKKVAKARTVNFRKLIAPKGTGEEMAIISDVILSENKKRRRICTPGADWLKA